MGNSNGMMKLYKYRPLSEFLYKELFYQELYFASYQELNDPLDLSARVEFTSHSEEQINYLIWFLSKSTLIPLIGSAHELSKPEKINYANLEAFNLNSEVKDALRQNIHSALLEIREENKNIWIDDIVNIVIACCRKQQLGVEFNFQSFRLELNRLTKKFLENSYTTCFSSVNNDFLMWAHYASKHSGICLEFTLEHSGLFPYKKTGKRKPNREQYLKRMSEWNIDEQIIWDRIKPVAYQAEQPSINFFDLAPVFDNEHDADLIGLSKGWTHEFARELESIFSTKAQQWSYEKEWRAIQINFKESEEPEDKIRHYPVEALSGIYFGIRTPEHAKKRIWNIFKDLNEDINYFDCELTNDRELDFSIWEVPE